MSCQDCLNRREFLARSTLAAAALAALEACGDGQIGPTAVTLGRSVTVTLSDFPDLATVGRVVSISPDRALVRTSATSFAAFSKICTHQGCLTDVQNNRFECPCHGSIFAADGSVIHGPSIPPFDIGPLESLAATFNQAAGTVTVA